MYPYPPHQNQDEPTMADVRGVLPGQRPPVDITVRDEPTSEVPVIKPASTPGGEAPEQESAAADTQTPAAEAADQQQEHQPDDQAEAPPSGDQQAEAQPDQQAEAT